MVHGFQLFEIWQRHSVDGGADFFDFQASYKKAAGSKMLLCFSFLYDVPLECQIERLDHGFLFCCMDHVLEILSHAKACVRCLWKSLGLVIHVHQQSRCPK